MGANPTSKTPMSATPMRSAANVSLTRCSAPDRHENTWRLGKQRSAQQKTPRVTLSGTKKSWRPPLKRDITSPTSEVVTATTSERRMIIP